MSTHSVLESRELGRMLLLPSVRDAGYARVNWGRWVVDCSRPYCTGALGLCPPWHLPNGRILTGLEYGQRYMDCWDCGHRTQPIIWPPDPDAIEAILGMRPDETTRNWSHSETLTELLNENIAHGILPPNLDLAGPEQQLMIVVGERVVGGLMLDALPSSAGRRRTIGGQ